MANTYTTAGLVSALNNINSATSKTQTARFFANGGLLNMSTAPVSQYQSKPMINGVVQNGTLFISAPSINSLKEAAGLTPTKAMQAILAHEMGHAFYQQLLYLRQPGDNADIGAKADWCFMREGAASIYAYTVALESGSNFVAGTTMFPNLYDAIAARMVGLTPGTQQFQDIGIRIASEYFAGDLAYIAFCYNPRNWEPPKIYPISSVPGNETSFAAWSCGRIPQAGGYWQKVNTSE